MIVKLVSYTLWDDIQEKLGNPFEYGLQNMERWKSIRCCRLEKEWISEFFEQKNIRDMTGLTPTFIVAQTGRGKTTMIFEECIPLAIREGRKVLYLAGRISLTTQIKHLAMDNESNSNARGDYMKVREMKKEYSPMMLKKCNNFGNIEIYTYQEILSRIDRMDFTRYSVVILDEAHYFVADSTFNPFTEEVLDKLIEKFKHTRRIYLTATPEESIDTIYNKEVHNDDGEYNSNELRVFAMQEDYTYLNAVFFSEFTWIVATIKNSDNKDKWLIFVREKTSGEKLLAELSSLEGGCIFMTTDTDKSSKEYQQLIEEERIPTRILIATKFLDVGVNIKTPNLHVVIFNDDMVEAKQMIGRKRVEEGETVEVFFYIPTLAELKQRLGNVSKAIRDEKALLDGIEIVNNYYDALQPPLFCKGNEVRYNSLSIKKKECDKSRYEKLISMLGDCGKDRLKYNQIYQEWVIKHFPGARIANASRESFEDEISGKVAEFVAKWSHKTLNKEELDVF